MTRIQKETPTRLSKELSFLAGVPTPTRGAVAPTVASAAALLLPAEHTIGLADSEEEDRSDDQYDYESLHMRVSLWFIIPKTFCYSSNEPIWKKANEATHAKAMV